MGVFNHAEFDNHEQVIFCRDENAGLSAIIALHDTTLGPAAGGCRMWPYPSINDALTDVLRLSRAMSYKNGLAGLPLGGGKSVIIGDPERDKNETLLKSFAGFVQKLGGQYYTAEDIGIGINDVKIFAETCHYIFGYSTDPSPFTARGCCEGIKAAVMHHLGRNDLQGLKAAVQGVGNVGKILCKNLHEAGTKLIVSDINPEAVAYAVNNFGADAVAPDEIYDQEVDIFSPCAMGGILNDDSIPRLRTSIIAGAANNQLEHPRHGRLLREKGILFAPDYVINAGGMLQASSDIFGNFDIDLIMKRITGIYDTSLEIFKLSEQKNRATHEIADELAKKRIADATGQQKVTP